MHIIEFVGRIFLSAIFLLAGVGKIFNYESTIEYMESFNVPGYLITPAIIIEILFPILIIIGYRTKLSAIILSLFAILLAIIFHNDFSNQMQFVSFFKNIGLAGGFLFLVVNGAKDFSLDKKFN